MNMKVLHTFKLPLTKAQKDKLNRIWAKHSEEGGAIILQPVLKWGPFRIGKPKFNGAIFDKNLATQINDLIEKAEKL